MMATRSVAMSRPYAERQDEDRHVLIILVPELYSGTHHSWELYSHTS